MKLHGFPNHQKYLRRLKNIFCSFCRRTGNEISKPSDPMPAQQSTYHDLYSVVLCPGAGTVERPQEKLY